MQKNDLLENLKNLDKEVSLIYLPSNKIKIVIVGSGSLILQGFLTRATNDIDVVGFSYPELIHILEEYNVNCRSNAFSDCLAINYEDRLVKIELETKVFDYYALSLEDMVIMKLFSDRDKNKSDIRERNFRPFRHCRLRINL